VPEDPGGPDEFEKQGKLVFDFGMMWFKGQHMGTGQCPVKKYNRHLRNLIHAGKAEPSFIVSHRVGLGEAPDAYQHFDSRDEGWTKVVLKPSQNGAAARA
jgi:glutathione-independent formaldehyde dehydrogenase